MAARQRSKHSIDSNGRCTCHLVPVGICPFNMRQSDPVSSQASLIGITGHTDIGPSLEDKLYEFALGLAGSSGELDESVKDSPRRWMKAMREMTRGYDVDVAKMLKQFDGVKYNGIVVVGPIEFYSTCEHHWMPFGGRAWVGYLPNKKTGRIVGLSKLARLVDAHAKRLQVQERLTGDIANDIMVHLNAQGAGVYIESVHTCMCARGVEKEGPMRTQELLGNFKKRDVRAEFIHLCGVGNAR